MWRKPRYMWKISGRNSRLSQSQQRGEALQSLGEYFKSPLTSYTRLLICSLLNDEFLQENKSHNKNSCGKADQKVTFVLFPLTSYMEIVSLIHTKPTHKQYSMVCLKPKTERQLLSWLIHVLYIAVRTAPLKGEATSSWLGRVTMRRVLVGRFWRGKSAGPLLSAIVSLYEIVPLPESAKKLAYRDRFGSEWHRQSLRSSSRE